MTSGLPKESGLKKGAEKRDLSDKFRKYIGRQVSYYTHGIHKYPAKFIPQVPRFCITRYSKPEDKVLDPFMGSGTTLLEAMLLGRGGYGIDIHPLARLISKVKITPISSAKLQSIAESLIAAINADDDEHSEWVPQIPNLDHWFMKDVALDLATIKMHIWKLREGPEKDFFKICFSSIIRKVSNSDNYSLIPEVTSFQKKLVEQNKVDFDSMTRIENAIRQKLIDMQDLNIAIKKSHKEFKRKSSAHIIGRDARDINLPDEDIDLGVTSPPYASAVHYVSVHKFEMYWLDLMDIDPELSKKIVGTVKAYAVEYKNWEPGGIHPEIDRLVRKVANSDQKSGFILQKYFADMKMNLEEVNRVLTKNGTYCLVAGENVFKKVKIPTYKMLDLLAKETGFERESIFHYDIINRHLDVPRWNESTILQDHILVFKKVS